MNRYIWYHPLYIKQDQQKSLNAKCAPGQIRNAQEYGYIYLSENQLNKVGINDHLTIVGHSSVGDLVDDGLTLQGDNAEALVKRLKRSGLQVAPKILSLESCKVGINNGLGFKLSSNIFFRNSIIEASDSSVGRNPGFINWNGFKLDSFGRILLKEELSLWKIIFRGKLFSSFRHAQYNLVEEVDKYLSKNIHIEFMNCYKPGLFGGRAGRYSWFYNREITLEKATYFARDNLESASARALESMSKL